MTFRELLPASESLKFGDTMEESGKYRARSDSSTMVEAVKQLQPIVLGPGRQPVRTRVME